MPGNEEVKQGISLASNPKLMNAGSYCRKALAAIFDNDADIPNEYKPFDRHVFFTNMIKCSTQTRGTKKNIKASNISACKGWLNIELSQLPIGVPILIASSEAVKGLLGEGNTLYNNRCKIHQVGDSPAIVTMNPIEPARYCTYTATDFRRARDGSLSPKTLVMNGPSIGSVPWFFKRDLISAKELVKEFINNNNSNNNSNKD
jgi:hypothetical protein